MGQILGSTIKLQLRESGTTGAYLELICETENSLDGTSNVTTTVTKCSTVQTVSPPVYNFNFDAVADTAPSGTQVSYEQMLAWFNGNTLLDLKRESPSGGADFHQAITVYISALSDAAPAEGAFTFSGTLAGTGTMDLIP